jgi:hypothetical protein
LKTKFTLAIASALFCGSLFAQTTLISPTGDGGFETGSGFSPNNWTAVNGAYTNKWVVSSTATAGFSGARCAYVSNSAGPTYNHTFTNSSASIVHFYRDVTFPANQGLISLTFNYIGRGDAGGNDNVKVFIVPISTTPVAGTALTSTLIGGPYSGNTAWQSASISLPCSYSGQTLRLVFSWENNASNGNSPPGGIDNVSLTCQTGCVSSLGTGVINVASLPYSSGAGSTCGEVNDLTAANMVVCGSNWYLGGEDQVYIFTPTTSGSSTISITSTGSYMGLMLYDGCPLISNPCGGPSGACVASAMSYAGNQTIIACLTAGTTYYLVIDSWPAPNCNPYSNLTISAPATASCTSAMGTGLVAVAALPYTSNGRTTCGKIDDITQSTAITCGANYYFTGEDEVFQFTPTSSGNITVNLTSTGSYTNISLYNGCPSTAGCSGTPGVCVAYQQSYSGSKSMCAPVIAGITYYLVVDSWTTPYCNPYDISISAPTGTPAGTTCSNAPAITLPYTATGQTTACFGNDYTNASTGSCGSLYESGEDRVYALTVASAQCIGVTLSNASSTSIGFQVYSGCPGSAGAACVGSFGGANPLTGTVTLPSAGTYYIVVDSWANPSSVNYDINVISYGSGPANDLPCNAQLLTINTSASGDNACSSGAGEPAAPTCWYNGNLNTVWFKVVCPASGNLKVTTTAGSLTDTQIQLWSGASCATLTAVAGGCNDNAAVCSGWVYYSSVSLTGLTAGATYYISVDGYYNATGTFSIVAFDGNNVIPTTQDCSGAVSVCSTVITQPNSFFGCGNINDIPSSGSFGNPSTNPASTNSGCMFSNELNTVWYNITISTNGNLAWTLTKPTSGYYDWNLYPLTTNSCTDIANNLVAPIRCNWNCTSTGATGMETNANIPVGSSACNFEPVLAVTAGQTYSLCLSNYSGGNTGYTLDFSNSTCGIATPTSLTWTGSTSTAWTTTTNWGGCSPPSCTMDANIITASNQPVISTNTTVRNLTIQAGASLTINAGVTLTLCGDLNVYGTLICSPTATILFNNGTANQAINGTVSGTNALGNLTITKTGGIVTCNSDVDIAGTFTTSNSTSVFNTTGKYVKVAGNFVNAAGNTTFTNTGTTGTLEFNGAAAQTYNQGTSQLDLNFVKMNHSSTGVTLQTNLCIKAATGTLDLTAGKIITGANEVRVANTTPGCVNAGSATSYVEGYLRRWVTTGLYEFPVGEAVKGYERASVNFTANSNVSNLRANFVQYASTPAALNTTDCSSTYNMPALDDGKWIINAYDASLVQITGTCTYNMILYNRVGSYSNGSGNTGWTIMKDPNGTGAWAITGTCNASSTINATMRNGMTGFSHFGTSQSSAPLPIELTVFDGENHGDRNLLFWTTASELNNDYFTLERSADGIAFSEVTRVAGSGTTSQVHHYECYDFFPINGMNYYRLRQTDVNGSVSYSGVVVLENKYGTAAVENIHPNPTTDELNFDIVSTEKGPALVEVMDISGRVVMTYTEQVSEGRNSVRVDLSQLSEGVYMLKVSMACCNFTSVNKIVRD